MPVLPVSDSSHPSVMRGTRRPTGLSGAVNTPHSLPGTPPHRHPRSFVLHRTTLFRIRLGSAVMPEKPLQTPSIKAIRRCERLPGNGYIPTCTAAGQAHLMAVC
ncbi:hypothetical protein G6F65_012428 [Rhizopus arrhizus]|nr:hypothetical protein G6F65_012428 [Rhizopus arrhizus]